MNLNVFAFFAISVKTLGKTSEKLAVGVKVYSGMSGTSKLAIYAPMIMAVRNVFDACRYITRQGRKGLVRGNREFFGPC